MSGLLPAELLNLWERGSDRHPVDRALLALGCAFPQRSFAELADLPVGRRDAALLRLRCETFGQRLEGYTECPGCGLQVEFTMDGPSLADATPSPAPPETVSVAGDCFRLATSRDLARIAATPDEETAARQLLDFCRVSGDSDSDSWAHMGDEVLAEVESLMAQADPAADTELGLNCEACGECWAQAFDIVAFLWEEIEARARRLLYDVHLLARAYAWSEREVLALSDARREAYLAMVAT